MQPIRANDEVEFVLRFVRQQNSDLLLALIDSYNGLAEPGWHVLAGTISGRGEVTSAILT